MRRRFAEAHGRTLDFSSPADASSLTPSRPDYDTVSRGGGRRWGAVSRIDEKSSIPGIQGKENLKAGNSKISTQ
jgi:hypothetical protein